MDFTEKVLDKKEMYKGDFLTVERIKVQLPDNKEYFRDIIRHPGAAAIIAFIDEETIILEKQYRAPVGKTIYEIPAGKLEEGEEPLQAAKRELEEETGYKAENMECIGYIYVAPGFTDEKIYVYKAEGLHKGVKGGDEDEFIELSFFKLKDIKKMIREGQIVDAKTLSALMYL